MRISDWSSDVCSSDLVIPLSRIRALNARRNSRAVSFNRNPIDSFMAGHIIAAAIIFNAAMHSRAIASISGQFRALCLVFAPAGAQDTGHVSLRRSFLVVPLALQLSLDR